MQKNYSPLVWLAALGSGGIAVAPFSFFNYTVEHPAGLVNASQVGSSLLNQALEGSMLVFIILHFLLTAALMPGLLDFLRGKNYAAFSQNPLENSAILAPFISLTMSMNVLIGPIRYFLPALYENFQALVLPGFAVWILLWMLIMRMEIKLLTISFRQSFDIQKISFGWLLHPFALGMLTVVGAGLAALAADPAIANVSAFLSIISGSMGLFLLVVKLVALFKSHFAGSGLPAKEFLPSLLIVIPNLTLYAISAFRLGHWLEKFHAAELGGAYFKTVIVTAFAFETWYFAFGIVLLFDYFRRDFFREYHVSQWGLVCPVVAYGVLGSFFYNLFAPIFAVKIMIILVFFASVALFFFLLKKMLCCRKACGKFLCG